MRTFNLKIVFLCMLLSLVANGAFSQTENQIALLQKKKWVWTKPDGKIRLIMEFAQSEGSTTLAYADEEHRYPMLYYLSDSIPTTFDKEKPGKTTRGKYLVELRSLKENEKDYTNFDVSEIVALTPDFIKIKSINNTAVLEFKAE